ncbi:MAG: O-acetylhomoserine aminocarboxypropyltransferase/cysteine synthase [Anaerolineales bacterium]|jgi:O-acetylhomoserine (thiol)-lyase|uniref:O-acetylhomoserine aminocarboxypropyltransferase/cysteine synthase family protein n=1 Tax=Candidatus Villigracilis vicinus TaxID=3140679 RepID=UPI0031375BBA|nr:O-acetylhomoserine aminocarboxypropyltransferase/cysteine synthase [Anaerolineales bacterium]MBK9778497.1 O-acetylhomoserine aminocarboxypropyltransferase/cysteine synthase [Anaerolineales bacterium]
MTSPRKFGFNTRQLHEGYTPDPATGSRAVPIYQTTAYDLQSTDRAARLFALQESGNIYTRISNPTSNVFEKRITSLEGGVGAVEVGSGHAAQATAILTICEAGDHIVSTSTLYGGTVTQFKSTFPKLGINVTLVDPSDPENFRRAIQPNTKIIYGETISNPLGNIFPFDEVSKIAHEHGIPLMIDNTFATPYLCRPFEWGADIITHSTTKFIGGHGTTMGGIIVDGGKFNWRKSGRFKNFTEPDTAYHDVAYADDFGPLAFISKARAGILRDFGTVQQPIASWFLLQGLDTLSLRMERHVQNAQRVAEFLESHPNVNWVSYAGLASHPHYERAKKYLPLGTGAVMGFGVKGGREAGAKFIDNLQLFSHVANIGDTRSLAIHPASTTHSQLSDEEQTAAGVSPDFIRLSIGLEDIEDILWDLDQALRS